MKFWDSSAIVPLVSREAISGRVSRLLRRDPPFVVWALTPVEVYSALLRKRRQDQITAVDLRESRRRLGELSRAWTEVQSLDRVVARSFRVIDLHDLRAADALQLAAALIACGDKPRRLPFVSLDQRLCAAAEREGFQVIIP